MDANRTIPAVELKSELARFCLPEANRDPNRKLAWVNSICILFLLIGIVGAKSGSISLEKPPPLEEPIPVLVEPPPPPPTKTEQPQEQTDQEKPETPQVVVVTPASPSINFSVPTIGNVVVPNGIAVAPPINPMKPVEPLRNRPTTLNNTGSGGERPAPPYPKIAQDQGEQGSVTILITVDEAGLITSAELKSTSGYPVLDRSALDYVKKHWIIPPSDGNRLYETTINYRLKP
jgi:periplasmic protein TonB